MTREADIEAIPEKRRAPEGMIWQCTACGKKADDLYGMIGLRSPGWDESCMMNAVPVTRSTPSDKGTASDVAR